MTMLPQASSRNESLLDQIVARRRELRAKFFPSRQEIERRERIAAAERQAEIDAENAAQIARYIEAQEQRKSNEALSGKSEGLRAVVRSVCAAYGADIVGVMSATRRYGCDPSPPGLHVPLR